MCHQVRICGSFKQFRQKKQTNPYKLVLWKWWKMKD